MMKQFLMLLLTLLTGNSFSSAKKQADLKFFKPDNGNIQYVGRIDFSDRQKPRIWAPGVYIVAKFKGAKCQVFVNDEAAGANHNYLELVIDGKNPVRIKLTGKTNVISVPDGLTDAEHTILICKDTESNIGYIVFGGFKCEKLLPMQAKPKRKIEYFGDSITSGTAMDLSAVPCGKGLWYDQHNAFMSYGALTSRNLGAQWQISALAGVGLVHSCCNMKVLMPQIYDKVFLYRDSIKWNFNDYKPDVVTICLGQNDGPNQDSVLFCNAYVKLIGAIRLHCPNAAIICLGSPMADKILADVLQRNINGIAAYLNGRGDKKVYKYFFSKQYDDGCGGHPDLAEHQLIAGELTAYIRQLEHWN